MDMLQSGTIRSSTLSVQQADPVHVAIHAAIYDDDQAPSSAAKGEK
jgi:hypothetical protein